MDRVARGLRIILPDPIDAFAYTWMAGSILILANIPNLLTELGFTDYNHNLAALFGGHVTQWVEWLNNLQATKTIVTFLLWGSVGFAFFVIIQVILRAFTSIYEESVFITRYIRPPSSSQRNYLLFLLLGSLEFIASVVLLALAVMLTILVVLPSAVTAVQTTIINFSVLNLALAVEWLILLSAGICLIHTVISLMAHRHRVLDDA
jgi:hypothetical protein